MNANETHFAGIRFPSLVHAQWALFFEDLFIPWQFRSRSLTLGSGLEYEPDFWLPRQALWVQIGDRADGEDFRQWQEFAAAADDLPCEAGEQFTPGMGCGVHGVHTVEPLPEEWRARDVLFSIEGIPAPDDMSETGPRSALHCSMYTINNARYQWTVCETCGHVGAEHLGRADRLACGHGDLSRDENCRADDPRILGAYRIARQAVNARHGGACAGCASPLKQGDLVSAGRHVGRRRWYHAECLLADLRERHPRTPAQATAADAPDARLPLG